MIIQFPGGNRRQILLNMIEKWKEHREESEEYSGVDLSDEEFLLLHDMCAWAQAEHVAHLLLHYLYFLDEPDKIINSLFSEVPQ